MIRLYVSDGVQLFQERSKEAETRSLMWNISPIILRFVCSTVKHNHSEPWNNMLCLSKPLNPLKEQIWVNNIYMKLWSPLSLWGVSI